MVTIVLVDALTMISKGNHRQFKDEADFFFMFILFSNLVVHIFFLVKNTTRNIKLRLMRKRWCCYKDLATKRQRAKQAKEKSGEFVQVMQIVKDGDQGKELDVIQEDEEEQSNRVRDKEMVKEGERRVEEQKQEEEPPFERK